MAFCRNLGLAPLQSGRHSLQKRAEIRPGLLPAHKSHAHTAVPQRDLPAEGSRRHGPPHIYLRGVHRAILPQWDVSLHGPQKFARLHKSQCSVQGTAHPGSNHRDSRSDFFPRAQPGTEP